MVGYRSVLISWEPPYPTPLGYQVLVPTADITVSQISSRTYTATIPRGVHTIQVRSQSLHYFSEVESTRVTVRGEERIRHCHISV